jgi:NAD(P)-dependent dehydrogenase (short-subunit alcohol dehydrogenase family)
MTREHAAGKVAIITGAGSGAGRVIAQRLAADGFAIAIGDVQAATADTAAAEITASAGVDAAGFAVDVSQKASVDAFVAAVAEKFGRIDVLVNNAGVISLLPFPQIAEAEWDRVVDINLKGPFLMTQAVHPHITQRGWGRIVNISSDVGKRGEENLAHYCASKFGVIGLTQSTAVELARAGTGVTVNAICPAIMNTNMMKQVADERSVIVGGTAQDTLAHLHDGIPLGRVTEPTDIANTVSFLCSDDASFLTGQSLNVTGGSWMA